MRNRILFAALLAGALPACALAQGAEYHLGPREKLFIRIGQWDPVSQTYTHDSRIKSSATTRILEIPKGGDTVLEFDLYKATRVGKYLDVFQVLALRDGALFPLWSSKSFGDGTTAGAWERIKVPLSDYAGQSLQIRFVFDSFDAPDSPFEGTYLDTIELVTGCN